MNGLQNFLPGHDPKRNGNGRPRTKFMTELLVKELKGKEEIIIEGIDVVTRKPTKILVPMPTQRQIIQALLRQAKKGNVIAIKEVLDRVEGKTPQGISLTDQQGNDVPLRLIFQPAIDNEPLPDNG
jgi:hypothetical protein